MKWFKNNSRNQDASRLFSKYAIPFFVLTTFLVLLPTLLIVLYAFIQPSIKGTIFSFTLQNFIDFFKEASYLKIFGVSILLAIIATFLCFIIGFPVAYILSFHVKRKTGLILIFTMPIWLNGLLKVLSLRAILDMINPNVVGSLFSMELGMVFLFLPFMILSIFNVTSKIDKNLVEASSDLGANKLKTITKIILPLSLPGVMNGILLVFLPALTTLIIPQYLGGGKQLLIAKIIETFFINGGNLPVGASISVILSIFTIIILSISILVDRRYSVSKKKKVKKVPHV